MGPTARRPANPAPAQFGILSIFVALSGST